uniref:Uncharacterized protein n=1 Tax=Arundo donax TaxID=35708 RepID=A0A0A9AZC7_ARUDO
MNPGAWATAGATSSRGWGWGGAETTSGDESAIAATAACWLPLTVSLKDVEAEAGDPPPRA